MLQSSISTLAVLPSCLVLLVVLAGCPPQKFSTDEAQLTFAAEDLLVGALDGLDSGDPLLEGTPICATCSEALIDFGGSPWVSMECGEDGEHDVLACFQQDVEGGYLDGDGCVIADGLGDVRWTLEPVDCPLVAEGALLQSDGVTFTFIDASAASGTIVQWLEILADARNAWGDVSQPDGSGFGAYMRNPKDQPFHVVAGQPFIFRVALRDEENDEWLAWHGPSGSIDVESIRGRKPTMHAQGAGHVLLSIDEGAEAELHLTVDGHTWPVGRVAGVSADAPTSLKLVIAVWTGAGDEPAGLPIGARAVLRDDEDRLIYGAPVTWTVHGGQLALGDVSITTPGADYVEINDACIDPSDSSTRRMTLKASYGGLTDKVALRWTPDKSPGEPGWEPSELCTGDCSCRTGGAPAATSLPALSLVLAVLILARRRS